jgi:hypothetical protein
MSETDRDTSRTVVKTYVPAYERQEWDAHAEKLDMSRSEFVRTMVQAGRRGFEGTKTPTSEEETIQNTDTNSPDATETSDGLEMAILEVLSPEEYHSWEELLAIVTDDVEHRLEQTLQELQTDGKIQHSPRNGGYRLSEES